MEVSVRVQWQTTMIWGKRSLSLMGWFGLALGWFMVMVGWGYRGGEGFWDNLGLAIPIVLAGVCGTGSMAAGVIAILRQRERSALVLVSTMMGLLVTWFWLGEILSPH